MWLFFVCHRPLLPKKKLLNHYLFYRIRTAHVVQCAYFIHPPLPFCYGIFWVMFHLEHAIFQHIIHALHFQVVQVSECYYELHLRADMYTSRHTQWFYFAVSNTRKDITYRYDLMFSSLSSLINDLKECKKEKKVQAL